MIKKIRLVAPIVLLALLAVLLLVIAGCGNKSALPEDDLNKEVHLTWICVGDAPKDLPKVMEAVNKYTKEKINATVELKYITWADYQNKMNAAVSAGDDYDLCFTANWTFDYQRYARQGVFYPLNDLTEKYGGDLKKTIDIMPKLIDSAKIDGNIYAMPVYTYPLQQGWYYNKNIVGKYNFDLAGVTKIEDLFPLFDKVKRDNPGTICIADFGTLDGCDKYDWMLSNGLPCAVKLNDASCKVINPYEDQEYINILKNKREVYLKGYTYKDVVNNNKDQDFKAGKVLAFVGNYTPSSQIDSNRGSNVPILVYPAYPRPVSVNMAFGAMMAINNSSKNPERAFKFMSLLYTDSKLRNLLGFGIEGIHYQKVAGKDNVIKQLPAHADYEVPDWLFGNRLITYTLDSEPENKWEQYKKASDIMIWSPLFGFNADSSPVQNEITAMTNVVAKYRDILRNGAGDTDSLLTKINTELRAAGMDKFIAELQKQIDTWKATGKN